MRAVIFSPGDDIGGVGIGIKHAFERHAPDWDVTAIRMSNNILDYPEDVHGGAIHVSDLKEYLSTCDVLHLMERPDGIEKLGLVGKTPLVLHHHGETYRTDYRKEIDLFIEQVRPVVLASTLDLVPLGKRPSMWLPNPQNLDMLACIRAQHHEQWDFVHAPTVPERKHTSTFQQAAADLQASYDLIRNQTWANTLDRKAKARALYDQMIAGYGLNALEAWGMGMPVIAGVQDSGVRDLMLSTIGYLPFYEATPETLRDRMRELMQDEGLRRRWGERGLAYVHDWHDERRTVRTLKEVYQRAYDEYHSA